MYYKEDWNKAMARFEALWQNEIIDRCCISIVSPRKNQEENFRLITRSPMTVLENRYEPEKILKRKKQEFETTFYGGEAFPQIWLNYGPVRNVFSLV